MIKVWNSAGREHVNNAYLAHALRYLYDDFTAASPGVTPPFNVWHRPRTLEERSEDFPRQSNSYVCGIFTMVSIVLLAQGVRLNQHSCTQSIVYGLATRRRIVYLIWVSGRNNRGTQPRGITGFLRTSTTQPNPSP